MRNNVNYRIRYTHLDLKSVRIPLKMLLKKIIKDFNVKLICNYQKMVEFLWISLITAKRECMPQKMVELLWISLITAKPPILWPSEKVQPYKPTWGSDLTHPDIRSRFLPPLGRPFLRKNNNSLFFCGYSFLFRILLRILL